MASLSSFSDHQLVRRARQILERPSHTPRWDANGCTQCRVADRMINEVVNRQSAPDRRKTLKTLRMLPAAKLDELQCRLDKRLHNASDSARRWRIIKKQYKISNEIRRRDGFV